MGRAKWWGWGDEGVAFTHEDKPGLGPSSSATSTLDLARRDARRSAFDDLDVPEPTLRPSLRAALERAAGAEQVSTDALDRVVHARGKSLRDLVRHRRGDLGRLPDVVVRPGDEEEVAAILRAALDADAVVIPFGGGTNISGSLEAPADEERARRLGRPRPPGPGARDRRRLAPGAGAGGRRSARTSRSSSTRRGGRSGHFPDSFTHSTLGGWIATRSSGMQSDKYGDIADLTRAVRVVTPAGMLVTRPVPSTSTGPSVREMVLGSEGRLGIITRGDGARAPRARAAHDPRLPLPRLGRALAAMREIAASEASPSVTRVSDATRRAFSFATRKAPDAGRPAEVEGADDVPAAPQAASTSRRCACRSSATRARERHVAAQRKLVGRDRRAATAACASARGPASCTTRRSSTRPTSATTCSTAARWPTCRRPRRRGARCRPLYDNVMAAARGAFDDLGVTGYIMCHLSHSYHAGACLYFTFALQAVRGRDAARASTTWSSPPSSRRSSTRAPRSRTTTRSAPSTRRWLEQDISAPGVAMLRALFDGMDPGANLNPGKIVSSSRSRV